MASRRVFVLLAIVSSFYGVRCNSSSSVLVSELLATASATTAKASAVSSEGQLSVPPAKTAATPSPSATADPPVPTTSPIAAPKSLQVTTATRSIPTTPNGPPSIAIPTSSPTPSAPCKTMTVNITFTLCKAEWKTGYYNTSSAEFRNFTTVNENMFKNVVFPASGHDVNMVEIQKLEKKGEKTRATVTITFGPPKESETLFEKRLLEFRGKTTSSECMEDIEVEVEGANIGNWTVNDGDCKKKCCDGGGGQIMFDRTCSSDPLCVCNRVLQKIEKLPAVPCTKLCGCDSGSSVTASLFLVLAALIMASA